MTRFTRTGVVAGGAIACAIVIGVAPGCGLDAPGSLLVADVPDAMPVAVVEASVDAGVDAPSADANADAEGGPPVLGLCDDPAILLCLRFNGSALDGAHGQNVAVTGAVTYVDGVDGKAALLDATSSVTLADNAAWKYTTLTVEMWARPDALPALGGRAGLMDKDGSFGVFAYGDGTVGCVLGATASGPVFAATGTWVHVACVNDGTATKLYVGGVLVTSVASGTVGTTTALVAIGNNSPNLGNPWLGALDTVRVYTRAKTAVEISADAKR